MLPNSQSATGKCSRDGLRVCCLNANSILAHIETIRLFLASRPYYHIIAITETKFSEQQEDHKLSLGDYVVFRRDRNRNGGSVALLIHKSLTSKLLCSSTEEWKCQSGTPEYILCEVQGKGITPFFAAVVYRPPHAPFLENTNFIDDLTVHMHNYNTKIIIGDCNANQLRNSFDGVFIRNLLSSNSLQLVPHGATYHRDSGTWLDLCIIDKQDTLLDYWKSETPFIDNHSIITATIDVSVPKFIAKPFSYLDFKSVNNNDLVAYFRSCDWTVGSDTRNQNCLCSTVIFHQP